MKDSKVVWILNHYAGSRIHGMEYRHFYLAKYFREMGIELIIISASFHHLLTKPPTTKYEQVDGIPYIWVKTFRYRKNNIRRVINMFEFSLRLAFKRTKQLPEPDVIIASSPHPFVALNGYLFAKRYKAKFLFEVRDLWPLTLIEWGYSVNHPLIKSMSIIEKFTYKHCDYTVSLISGAKEYMIKHGLRGDKFVYIPNGIDLKIIDTNISKLPERHNKIINDLKKEGKLIVLYIGNHGTANALDNLIEAAKILHRDPKIHFVLVGKGPEKEDLIRKVQNYNLSNTTFLDPVDKSQVSSLTREGDIGYIGLQKKDLFKYGVSPNKLFEYMASGLPIVSAIDTTGDEVLEAACGFSVPAENPLALAETLKETSKLSKKRLNEMGKRGQEYVKKTHSYEVLAQEYVKLF
ncbi:MAG: glycosyltransferase family 4 protein [Planctomycetota bacterium]|jgi:glycosyltransferase involved in cell wall biosynthesis